MTINIRPQFTTNSELAATVKTSGYAVLHPNNAKALVGCTFDDTAAWLLGWNDLPLDAYLKDGGRYRRRRHSCFVVNGETVEQTEHRAHWQPLEYNALHGGMQRMFEPMSITVTGSEAWERLLINLGDVCTALKPSVETWFIEAHQFRIDTTDGIGRPTPEGAHRDGVDFVAVIMVARHNLKGGETRVFDIDGPAGQRFTMTEPWTMLLLDDEQVIHESTPIQPMDGDDAYRDTLVITLRAKAFQGS